MKLPKVMGPMSANASTSSLATKPPLRVTVADSMLVSSASLTVRVVSMTRAPSPSV